MKYRPDIDGLRALAVVLVVLFHAGVPGFAGGYTGVDVFFVISGFLITGIVVRDIDKGQFSLLRFYERRFRRLLPAVVAMTAVVFAAAWPLLSPEQLRGLAGQAMAVSVFASNIYFWRTENYFAPAAEDQFLLHTWSLGVEEHFYLLFPFALVLIGRRAALRIRLVAGVAVVSLALSAFLTVERPSFAFYMLPTRAWELMVGALLALGVGKGIQKSRASSLLPVFGLLLICASTTLYSKSTVFPGYAALAPVMGAAAILLTGGTKGTWVNALLSTKPLVLVGKLSYSLYLWHWPVLLLARKYVHAGLHPSIPTVVVAVVASFGLSYASWRWIENPFRYSSISRGQVFARAGVMTAGVALVSIGVWSSSERLTLWSDENLVLRRSAVAAPSCFPSRSVREECRLGGEDPTLAIWGDSHAQAMLPAFQVLADREDWGGIHYLRIGCPPLLDVYRPGRRWCSRSNRRTVEELAENAAIRTVVLAARWPISYHGTRPENPQRPVRIVDDSGLDQSPDSVFARGLRTTVTALRSSGKRVVLIGGTPEFAWDVPSTLALRRHLGRSDPEVASRAVLERHEPVNQLFAELSSDSEEVDFVDLLGEFCSEGVCQSSSDGVPLFSDGNHLSLFGSKSFLAPILLRELNFP